MALFRRRDRAARPAVPAPPSHAATVGGFPVEVHTPPGAVDARLTGHTRRQPYAVRPRHRPDPQVAIPPGAAALLEVVDGPVGRDVATGDPAFDDRFHVVAADPMRAGAELTSALREALLAHDVVFLVVSGGGLWVSVAHPDPAGVADAERAVLRLLELFVTTPPTAAGDWTP